jgi:uncharacterized membrane protein YeiH
MTAVEVPIWVDLLAVFAAGLAASLLATREKLDIVGVVLLTIVAALGGGIIRDTLIQRGTPAALVHSSYVLTACAAALFGFFFSRRIEAWDWALTVVDAAGLGLYTLVGVLKASAAGLPIPSMLLIGVLSTAGGGILRDVLLGQRANILLPGAPYALLSLIGGLIAVILDLTDTSHAWLWWLPVVVVIVLRLTAVRFHWETPTAVDAELRLRTMHPPRIPLTRRRSQYVGMGSRRERSRPEGPVAVADSEDDSRDE